MPACTMLSWFMKTKSWTQKALEKYTCETFLGANSKDQMDFGDMTLWILENESNKSLVHLTVVLSNRLFGVIPFPLDPALMLLIEPYVN